MLDPLTALSLASSVVQFVDFGTKLLRTGRELYDSSNGSSVGNQDLETIAKDLKGLNGRLRHRPSPQWTNLSDADRNLILLAEQCEDIADTLIDALEEVKLRSTPNRRFESFKQALKTFWKQDQLDATNARLQNFREQLNLHVLVSLREAFDIQAVKQLEGFRDLEKTTQELAEQLLESQEYIKRQLATNTNLVIRKQIKTNKLIGDEHERTRNEIIATIERNRQYDHDRRYIQSAVASDGQVESNEEKKRRREEEDKIEWEIMEKRRLEEERLEAIRLEKERKEKARLIPILILESLRFPTMTDRLEEIDTAHRNTFEWIFRQPDSNMQQKIWDSFPIWLEKLSGVYWMNGKAASGKSTLMRYIHNEPRTMELLEKWSDGSPLVVASHFFWNSGTPDQRSHVGLLRALLFNILEQIPQIIPEVFAHQFNERNKLPLSMVREGAFESWTLPKLSRAFKLLFTLEKSKETRFCLFVDGLDEYDGDYPEIIDLFLKISNLKNIKVCLSSRPLRDFVVSFKPFPKLRLQDLTFNDIKQYVDDELGAHPQMQELQRHEPEAAPRLVLDVVNKADGVFLWVKIVVVSLLRGLRNSDRISDLEERLRRLPPSLEDLFSHIIGRLEPVYLAQSSRIFQMFSKVQKQDPWFMGSFTSVELYFAEVVDRRAAMEAQTRTLTDEDLVFICDLVESWLQTRCGGLIEAHEDRRSFGRLNARLSYLHRTVRDFLELPDIWSQVMTWTARTEFDASLSLIQSQILYIKCLLYPVHPSKVSAIWGTHDARYYAHRALRYAHEAEEKNGRPEVMMLEELDRVCNDLFKEFVAQPYCWATDAIYNDDMEFVPFEQHYDSFLCVAVIDGLYHYVSDKIRSLPSIIGEKPGRPLLHYAVGPIESTGISYPPLIVSPKVVSLLLQHGARPNDKYKGWSAWGHVLAHLLNLLTQSKVQISLRADWLAIVKLFIQYGADAKECLNRDPNKSAHQLVTANFYETFPEETKEIQTMLVSSRLLIESGMPMQVDYSGQTNRIRFRESKPDNINSPQPLSVTSSRSTPAPDYVDRITRTPDGVIKLNEVSRSQILQQQKWTRKLFKRFRGSKSSLKDSLSPPPIMVHNCSEGKSPISSANPSPSPHIRDRSTPGSVDYFEDYNKVPSGRPELSNGSGVRGANDYRPPQMPKSNMPPQRPDIEQTLNRQRSFDSDVSSLSHHSMEG